MSRNNEKKELKSLQTAGSKCKKKHLNSLRLVCKSMNDRVKTSLFSYSVFFILSLVHVFSENESQIRCPYAKSARLIFFS